MKRFILFAGFSLFAAIGFSQQVSSGRNAEIKPAEKQEVSPEPVADSVAVLQSMSRSGQAVVVPVSTEVNQQAGKQEEKAQVHSSARKPD